MLNLFAGKKMVNHGGSEEKQILLSFSGLRGVADRSQTINMMRTDAEHLDHSRAPRSQQGEC